MRKNKALIFVCIILVVAMVMAMAAGCSKNNNGSVSIGDQNTTTISINNADKGQMFTILADEGVSYIDDKVNVVAVVSEEKVNVTIAKADNVDGKNVFTVYPPSGYYTMGAIYKITIDKSLSFSGYDSKVKSILFTITQDSLKGIQYVDGLIEFDSTRVLNKTENFGTRNNSGTNEVFGTMVLQTNGASVAKDDIILIKDKESSLVEAYKVENATNSTNSSMFVNYVKPQINEVYEEFEVKETKELDEESNIEFDTEKTEEALGESDLAMAAVSVFGSAPEFSVNPERLEDGSIKVSITMTIPGVVKIDSFATDLIVNIEAIMSADAIINADMEGNAVDCGVIANVYNVINTSVTIKGGYDYSSITNLTDLIEKTVQMQEEANAGDGASEGGVAVPMFTWVIPVGNGAVSVKYQCDLVFKFTFAGRLGITANADFNYMIGATYDKENGVSTYAEELDDSGLKNVNIDIEGSAKVKVGLKNSLSLDILAGVVSLGIQAELGNFNGLYGYATTGNLVGVENIEDVAVSGAIYFEGGFYYDVDLAVAISIGSIANVNKNIDIANDEIVLYSAGEPTVVTAIEGGEFELTALETELPEFNATAYDLKGMCNVDTVVSMADANAYVDPQGLYKIENGIVTVFNKVCKIDDKIELEYPTSYGVIAVPVTIKYDGSLVLSQSDFDYDKAGEGRKNDIVVTIEGTQVENLTSADEVSVDAKDAIISLVSGMLKVTIPYKTLADMNAGQNIVTINVGSAEAKLNINVSGLAAFDGFKYGEKYEVFTADQIKDLVAQSQAGKNFAGMNFVLTNDIDMGGAVIAPVASFAGNLDGQNFAISNYTVEGMSDNSTAFFAINRGEIKNLTLNGNVNAVISANTGNDYYVAGVVGKNLGNGMVSNVNVNGKITMTSTSLNAFVNIRIMSIVADGNSANGGNANVEINAVSQFDIANVTIEIDGNANYSYGCANAAVDGGALVKFEIIK